MKRTGIMSVISGDHWGDGSWTYKVRCHLCGGAKVFDSYDAAQKGKRKHRRKCSGNKTH